MCASRVKVKVFYVCYCIKEQIEPFCIQPLISKYILYTVNFTLNEHN